MKSKIFLFAAAMFISHITWAATPENGWWWNPAQPGTGYNIESQNGTLFIATFVYEDGKAVWFSGAGQINQGDVITINLLRSSGGQCLGCAYTAPQSSDSGFQIALSFSDNSHGIIRLNGVETPIERFNFNLGVGAEKLLGGWTMNIVGPIRNGLGVSDGIVYTRIEDGTVIGMSTFNTNLITSAATPVENVENTYASITQISSAEKVIAVFKLSGLDVAIGLAAIVDLGASAQEALQKLQEAGSLFIGFRTASSTASINNTSAARVSSTSTAAPLNPDIAQIPYEVNEIAATIDKETIKKIMRMATQIKRATCALFSN